MTYTQWIDRLDRVVAAYKAFHVDLEQNSSLQLDDETWAEDFAHFESDF